MNKTLYRLAYRNIIKYKKHYIFVSLIILFISIFIVHIQLFKLLIFK